MKNLGKHFVCLSDGAYSDYTPEYWFGDREIGQEEFDEKAREFGDIANEWYFGLPTKGFYSDWREKIVLERVDENGTRVSEEDACALWKMAMRKWLEDEGFQKLELEDTPEINVSYSDYPCNPRKPERFE